MSQLTDEWTNKKLEELSLMVTCRLKATIEQQTPIITEYQTAVRENPDIVKAESVEQAEFIAAQGNNLLAARKENALTYQS